jgi:hypothetical protein
LIRPGPGYDPEEMPNFRLAELEARKRSKTNTGGVIEVLVEEDDGRLFVDAIFLRGRKLQRGQRARTSSRLGLPPKV